jgi:DNA recombination protein RmuC
MLDTLGWAGSDLALVGALVVGLALGAGVAALAARSLLRERARRIEALEAERALQEANQNDLRDGLATLRAEHARLEQAQRSERSAAAEKIETLVKAEERLRDTFRALSADALERSSQSFLALARTSLGEFQLGAVADLDKRQQAIDTLLAPMRESLQRVDVQLQQVEKERYGHYTQLVQRITQVVETQEALRSETGKLVQALRQPTVRGRWGEIQLRRVVEMADMLAHCDFVEQASVEGEDGRLRPDLVVKLPGGKHVVVDAKAPLAAYLEGLDATDDPAREARLKDHARAVREHMQQLGAKRYTEQFQPAPEFVVMFLPGEAFFSAALQHDPALIEFGVERRVIPASPTTLIALLRAVAYGWQQERIAQSAHEISQLGRELYERLAGLGEKFERVGNHLDKATESYNAAVATLETRVLVSARRFRELGVSATKEIEPLAGIDRVARSVQAAELRGDEDELTSAILDGEEIIVS